MGQRYEFFLYFQIFFLEIVGIGPFVMECELCVYGQGKRETEMITRILLRTQLGASLN
nr:MAG TPA: hypothetical protein [Microviridae sp.]